MNSDSLFRGAFCFLATAVAIAACDIYFNGSEIVWLVLCNPTLHRHVNDVLKHVDVQLPVCW